MIYLGKRLKTFVTFDFVLFFMSGTWYESPSIGATQTRAYIHTTEMTQLPSLIEEICEK